MTSATASSTSPSDLSEQQLVVVELGERFVKVGVRHEAGPRCFVDMNGSLPNSSQEWVNLFRVLYFKYLQMDPRERRLVLVHPVLYDKAMLDMITDVPAVYCVPLPISASCFIPDMSALVLDIGYNETRCCAVYEGNVLTKSITYNNNGARHLLQQLQRLLMDECTVESRVIQCKPRDNYRDSALASAKASSSSSPSSGTGGIEIDRPVVTLSTKPLAAFAVNWSNSSHATSVDLLNNRITLNIEELAIKICCADPSVVNSNGGPDTDARPWPMHGQPLSQRPSDAKDVINDEPVPPVVDDDDDEHHHKSLLGMEIRLDARSILHVTPHTRQLSCECLFENILENPESMSIVDVVLNSLSRLPRDLIAFFSSRLLLCGGVAMIPGVRERISAEIIRRLTAGQPVVASDDEDDDFIIRGDFKHFQKIRWVIPSNNPECLGWAGGAVCAGTIATNVNQSFKKLYKPKPSKSEQKTDFSIVAIVLEDLETIQNILKKNRNLEIKFDLLTGEPSAKSFATPLQVALYLNRTDIITALLEFSNDLDSCSRTSLMYAVSSPWIPSNALADVCDRLITSGVDVHAVDIDDRTVAHYACMTSSTAVDVVVGMSANVWHVDVDGVRPLHLALLRGDGHVLEQNMLKSMNVDISDDVVMIDKFGRSMLHYAVLSRDDMLASRVAEMSSDRVLSAADSTGLTALHHAASYGMTECVRTISKRFKGDISVYDRALDGDHVAAASVLAV